MAGHQGNYCSRDDNEGISTMRIDRLVVAALALSGCTIVTSCGDNNVTPSNNSGNAPAVVDSVLHEDTTPVVGTEPVGQPGYLVRP